MQKLNATTKRELILFHTHTRMLTKLAIRIAKDRIASGDKPQETKHTEY